MYDPTTYETMIPGLSSVVQSLNRLCCLDVIKSGTAAKDIRVNVQKQNMVFFSTSLSSLWLLALTIGYYLHYADSKISCKHKALKKYRLSQRL